MKYSIPKNCDNISDIDGVLYFAQRLEEMLFNYTIDLFRMPLLNTHGLTKEYCVVAQKVKKQEIREYQLAVVFDEFIESFKNDIVIKECWGQNNIDRIQKSFGSSSDQEKYDTIAYLNATFDNGKYYYWCVETIKKYSKLPKQKKKMESALRCWIPEILSMGYNSDYIYNELKRHFFSNNKITCNSVADFLDIFDFEAHEYSVYFSVSKISLKFKEILEKRIRLRFDDDGNFSDFKKDRDKVIVYFEKIKAPCPNIAAEIAYSRLDLFFSFYKFVGNKRFFSIQKKAMIIEKEQLPIFVDAHKFSYNIIDDIDFEKIGTTSDSLLTGLIVNAESEYSLLRKSIELHNTALAVPDLKSGFLNLWASIEVLCQPKNGGNKFEYVLKNIIPILKKEYLPSIINNIIENLKENLSEEKYNEIIGLVDEVGCENKKFFYLLLLPKYGESRNRMYELLEEYPVLRSRIALIAALNTTKKLKEYIEKYIQRVTWHLYRMYRTRNSIIHSGEVPHNIKYLGEHLHSYVDTTLSEFIIKLSGDIPFDSTNNVIIDVKFANERIESSLEKEQEVDEKIVDMLIHPEIGYTMHCKEHISN